MESIEKEYITNANPIQSFQIDIAVIFTILWVFGVCLLPVFLYIEGGQGYSFQNLKLNEVGDYFAGVAAPIAFFWLVMGYSQQSRELGINNKILELQQVELEKSVIAQTEQAENMKEQLRLIVRDKYYPKFNLNNFSIDGEYIEIILMNTSNEVHQINATVLSDNMVVVNTKIPDKNKVQIDIQMVEILNNTNNSFDIILTLEFLLDSADKVSICYKIECFELLQASERKSELIVMECGA